MTASTFHVTGLRMNATLRHGVQSIWGLTQDNGDRHHGLYSYVVGCAADAPSVNESGCIKANVDNTGRFAYFQRMVDFEDRLRHLMG